jgi:DNA polymerase III epsilon subunit-like protein
MRLLREYIRQCLLQESKLSGRTIKGVLDLLDGYADNTWIFFDTETTGIHPGSAQLTEIGAIAVDPNAWAADASVLGEFNEKIKLEQETLDKIARQKARGVEDEGARKKMSVTDILSMTRYGDSDGDYGLEQEVLDRFLEWIESFPNPLLVAQNARFDMRFISVRSEGELPTYPVLDTQELMKLYLVPLLKTQAAAEGGDTQAQELLDKLYVNKGNWGYHSVSMGVVSQAYGIDIEDWHNALADVKMMMEMYKSVVDTIRQGMEVDINQEQGKVLSRRKKR